MPTMPPIPLSRNRVNMTVKEVGFATQDVRKTMQYHLDHCAYSWRVWHEVRTAGPNMPRYVVELEHTHHCTMILMDTSIAADAITATIHVGAHKCVDP
ncbi:uncharacterized protein M421DRAFT_414905 [Didymella exigua CBS 183.55]|uniref:Uncharacterized protein n=1 Tax=Didymella exigua CBS 183.55 TaxID=1150837 RepID=A0A6A5S3D8_9PLEO|nr:uncharacterized protein M421DRAFT_414905 [Didymella exigua CBS 183.55]KAF1933848.1 hypothetical protein M421DRAFT_414905 [Didymella exigua CBS 183.55]